MRQSVDIFIIIFNLTFYFFEFVFGTNTERPLKATMAIFLLFCFLNCPMHDWLLKYMVHMVSD